MAGYKQNQLKTKSFEDIQMLFDKAMTRKLYENVEAEVDDDQEEAEMKKHMEIVPDDEKLVKAKHGLTRLEESYERVLWDDLKVMFEHDVESDPTCDVNFRFGNDHFAAITGYGDYVQGNLTICHVYYVEGLGYNLFSIRQFCDGDLEVAFRSNTCYVQNLEGDDLLMGSRDSNLYRISISEMAASSPVCLMSRATSTKS
ncbi:hypothetical protein Tco_1264009 [Tanacetum coccineum]